MSEKSMKQSTTDESRAKPDYGACCRNKVHRSAAHLGVSG
jgi:hypothetical protein